jgi:multiple sugar transport system ATP-binding protein
MTLSGGQRQRVALGRALVRQPKVFLLDEPLSNLDAPMRAQLRAEIARLHARLGSTMLYVTHDQMEAMTLGNRVAVIHQGRIQQVASPLELYRHPANVFVAGFLGSPPMNFFDGALESGGGALLFRERAGSAIDMAAPLTLRLPPEFTQTLSAWAGKPITLGLRPEHFVVQTPGTVAGESAQVHATVEAAEPMGAENLLRLSTGTTALVVRVPAATLPRTADRLTLAIEAGEARFFDPGDGKALL